MSTQRIILTLLVLTLSFICLSYMAFKMIKTRDNTSISRREHLHLALSGLIAFFMDTIGVGSFACNIALAKYFNTFKDEELPTMINAAQVLPGALGALFFTSLIPVDGMTLGCLSFAACLGGMIGANVISKLNKQALRGIMLLLFPLLMLLILANQAHYLPVGGSKTILQGTALFLGCCGLFAAGGLTAAGIGLFAMVQAVLFCLGMSPVVTFPIMTMAGALQQPLSTLVFLKQSHTMPLKKISLVSLYGVLGVLLAIPLITHLNAEALHLLLVIILGYNTFRVFQSSRAHRKNHILNENQLPAI